MPEPNYLLRVTILNTESPTVMRQLSVPATVNFHDMHLIIQTAFGWGQCHPYKFSTKKEREDGKLREDIIIELDQANTVGLGPHTSRSSTDTLFSEILEISQQGAAIIEYQYDINDGWNHRIEYVGRAVESTETAICVAGEGHPCAEDVGGPSGWEELKLAYKKPLDDKFDVLANKRRRWYIQDCINGDPEGIADNGPYRWDREAVNKELGRLKLGQYEEDEEDEED